MPKVIKTTVYTLAELKAKHAEALSAGDSDAARDWESAIDRAREWLRDIATSDDWHDYVLELWKSALNEIGFPDSKIWYSGFWSQGDGACFECKRVDIEALANFMAADISPVDSIYCDEKGEEVFAGWIVKQIGGKRADTQYARLARLSDWIRAEVYHVGRYNHEQSATFRVDGPSRDAKKVEKLVDEFEKDAEELRRDLSRAIYKSLEDEYEYQTSDEALDEMADANEYTFTATGKRYG